MLNRSGAGEQARQAMKTFHTGRAAILLLVVCVPGATQPAQGSIQQGLAIARTHCARCHSIDASGPSPLPLAPPFRDLHKLYPVESLEEALAEGIMTGHSEMPQFRFEPEEIENLITWLKSLE